MRHAPIEAPSLEAGPGGPGPATSAAAGRCARVRRRLREEVARISAIFAYLLVVFGVLVLHETVVLSRHGIGYQFYGFAIVNSWILAKVVLVAEGVVARRPARRAPLVRIAARAGGFAVLLVCAYAVEETLIGLCKGRSLAESLPARSAAAACVVWPPSPSSWPSRSYRTSRGGSLSA
jgi:hypothetical protein